MHAIGRKGQPPPPPLNLVGDFGGGALYLAMGICAALVEVARSGKGQVIDCAMTDGAASLAAPFFGMRAAGLWSDERDANLLDGGAHFYDTYECQDGRWVAIGSIEPQFYALLLEKTGLAGDPEFAAQMDRASWPRLSTKLAAVIKTKTREAWCAIMEGTDVCFAPVLSWQEAIEHRAQPVAPDVRRGGRRDATECRAAVFANPRRRARARSAAGRSQRSGFCRLEGHAGALARQHSMRVRS